MASTVFNASVRSKLPLLHLLGRHPALGRFISIRSSDELCAQMLSVAVSWHVYAATHNAMSLAYVGLARFLPNIAVMLFAGHVADRFDRRWIISFAIGLQTLCVGTFGTLLATASLSMGMVYLLLLLFGAAQACSSPAMSALLPQLVSSEEFPHAVAVSSTALQICALAGPAIGGLIYALSAPGMFLLCAALHFAAMAQLPLLAHGHRSVRAEEASETDQSPFGGIRYVWSHGLLRGIILLDLFAVLLGGVTALLPIYAKDILLVGPVGLGCLRCAPGIGAGIVGLILAHHAIQQGVGKLMLFSVAGFGFATVVFALSTHLWLSLAALVWAGGFDMVSMVIRQTLLQVATPDAMRGRVSAVQSVCIGASSELGEFESGATAALFGTVPASLLGGLGTLVVVLLWAKLFPELARTDKLVTGQASSGGIKRMAIKVPLRYATVDDQCSIVRLPNLMPAKTELRPRTKPPEERRKELMTTAQRLFLEQGVASTTIEQITSGAGVAKGTFYLYFFSKEDILAALGELYGQELLVRIKSAVAEIRKEDWKGKLAAWARACVAGYLDSIRLHDILYYGSRPATREGLVDNIVIDDLYELLHAGVNAKAWSIDDPRLTAVFLFSGVHGAVDDAHLREKRINRIRLAGRVERLCFGAVGLAPGLDELIEP